MEEYHAEADAEIKHMGKYATARVYGEGERPGAVHAQLLKQRRDKSVVSEITTDTGNTPTTETDVVEQFRQYYSELYATCGGDTEEHILDYLTHIKLPWLSNVDRQFLMRPIEREEILLAISKMRPGSVPGGDGLTVVIYKAFLEILMPQLVTLFEDVRLRYDATIYEGSNNKKKKNYH